MQIPFTKMHGLGNDFVLLDERETSFDLSSDQLARIADRRFGVGCDQILVIEGSEMPNTLGRYRIFNADGSPAEHCGNGVRCVARYLVDAGEVIGDTISLEIRGVSYELSLTAEDEVRVDMGHPVFSPSEIPIGTAQQSLSYEIDLATEKREFGCVSMGNPHAVTLVEDVATAHVAQIGRALQTHDFFPVRVNVGFMQILRPDYIKLRVFERGVGETLACGTGACAAMSVGRLWGLLDPIVSVELPGGNLRIEWSGEANGTLWMTGPAEHVFDGIMHI